MDREGFRNRLKQYKEAKGFDPQLQYWEWKQKYDSAPQPDKMPGQPQSDQPMPSSQHLDNRSHRWDNRYSNVNRDPFDSPYDDSRYHDYRKPKFEFRKGDVHYSNPNVLKWMGRFGKVLRGGSLLGEVVQNLFPSEEAEAMEALRVKMDKQNKWLIGQEDVPKYDEGTDQVYDVGTLPEIVVTPEEWQKDFSKNFANARIRQNVYRGMPVYSKQTELQNVKKEYNKLNKLGQFTEESRKHFKNKVDSLQKDYHEFINDPDHPYQNTNDEIKRLYDIWNSAGRPKITSKNSIFGNVFGIKNAHWNPINNSIYNSGNINSIVSELAHPIQYKTGDKNRLVDYVLGFPKAIYGNFTKYDAYSDENHYEYDTHRNVEPALREYIANGKNTKYLNSFAEGGEITGPPTYEQWYADATKYNPTILDNASMYWSIEAAKNALHNEAMGLPGYAPMWNNYVRSLPKADPDINQFVDDLWTNENPNNVGLKNGKYYPHKSPEGGKMTIGPGFKLGSGQHKITEKQAKRGMTKSRLDQEVRRVAKGYFRDVDAAINSGQTTNPADTVSPQIKAGLADILHQTGSLKKWPKLINAVREGDLEKIQNEAIVTWRDNNGVLHEDKRRNELRNKNNWHYAEGTDQVEPTPEQVLEKSKPKINGIPITDSPIENVFSPLDVMLGTAYKLGPLVNKMLPNYGSALGSLVLGSDYNKKGNQPLMTKKLDPDVSEFYNDIVIPMNPNDEVYKRYFMKRFGDPNIEIHSMNDLPDGFAADFNPNTNLIRIGDKYALSPNYQQFEAHEYGHLLDKYLPYGDVTQQELNNTLPVSKTPISKDSDTYRERQSTKREAEFKTFKKLKDAGKLKLKTARAKTKRYQEYLANATDEEILELLGADTAYKKDYLNGNIDVDTLRQQMMYAPTIVAGMIVPTHLLQDDKEWT